MEELIYTSAPQGLLPGTSGFCTVEMTDGMPSETMDALESLSAYDGDASGTVNWMHVRIDTIRGVRHVFSRVAPVQGEFSGRSNKLAHHICVAPHEMSVMGPMAVVGPGGPLRSSWSGNVAKLRVRTSLSPGRATGSPRPCTAWANAGGDAGLAGAVVDRMRKLGDRPLYIVRTPEMDAIGMTDELLSLMPPGERTQVTFATYSHAMPRSVDCRLRWVVTGSPLAQTLSTVSPDCVIDLRTAASGAIESADPAAVTAARQGMTIGSTAAAATTARKAAAMPPPPTATAAKSPAMPVSGANVGNASHPVADAGYVLPPPPPETLSTSTKWIMVGVVSLMIPLCGLILFLLAHDPAADAAMASVQPSVVVAPTVRPPEKQVVAPEPKEESKPRAKNNKPSNKRDAKPKRPPPPKPPGDKPQTIEQPVRLPMSTLSLTRNEQPIFQGDKIYEVAMTKVAPSTGPLAFQLVPHDDTGVYDIVSVKNDDRTSNDRTSDASVMLAALYVEPDQVVLAWNPATEPELAADFVLAYEFLIKDQTHHTKLQLSFADPVAMPLSRVPNKRVATDVPRWISPEFPMVVRATIHSATSGKTLAMPKLNVTPVATPYEPKNESVSIKNLEDPWVNAAVFTVAAVFVGSQEGRKVVFASQLELRAGKTRFQWSERRVKINGNTADAIKKSGASISAADRLEVLEAWADGLRCVLECSVVTESREIVWARTPPMEIESANNLTASEEATP